MAKRKSTDFIAIHCSASQPKADIGAAEIDKMHRAKGWLKIGYHFVIRRNGQLEEGRQRDEPGAHVQGYNHNSVGICMIGGIDAAGKPENNFTEAQWATLAQLVKTLQSLYPKAVVQGHRDFPNVHKACPSFDVKEWVMTTLAN